MIDDKLIDILDNTRMLKYKRPNSERELRIEKAFMRRSRRIIDYPSETMILPVIWIDWYFSWNNIPDMPQQGDELYEEDGTLWTIHNAVLSEATGIWRCSSYRYDVSFGLDEYVDLISVREVEAGEDEEARKVYENVRVGIPAKFAPATINYATSGKDGPLESFYVLVRERPDLERIAMIQRADGKLYDIKLVREPEVRSGWYEIYVQRDI